MLDQIQSAARRWLFEEAAPMWLSTGLQPSGLFAEKIDLDGVACDLPLRMRVQARQLYSFCTVGSLGWDGPWRASCEKVLDHLLLQGRRSDGLCIHMFDPDGSVRDQSRDLYDIAFYIFALGHAGRVLNRPDAFAAADSILTTLKAEFARPEGGFWEGELVGCPPYRQNPHMHMFEASLCHAERGASGGQWLEEARALRALFVGKFQDSSTGAVTEYFDRDWGRLAGDEGAIVEPGHCLEWGWLFRFFFRDPEAHDVADRLIGFARTYGICDERGVAINEVMLDGSVRDANARLWPQTERLKAAVVRYREMRTAEEAYEVEKAYFGLKQYFETPTPGLWRDRMLKDGMFVEEPAPASSFYHIVCALCELLRLDLGDR